MTNDTLDLVCSDQIERHFRAPLYNELFQRMRVMVWMGTFCGIEAATVENVENMTHDALEDTRVGICDFTDRLAVETGGYNLFDAITSRLETPE